MSDALAPYVPRLVVDWVADEPERRHRTVVGTLVFADISGFTALTERLAVRGKAGAEEMSDLLNDAFEKLLTAAYDFGANLIKWGGDAVLLLFDGERHATRAAAAAWAMQRVMRSLGKLQTSAGQVRLGMSIGMNTGEIDFMLVGSLHRELIVTGPTASQTAVMEQQAGRGDVLMSQVTALLMPASCRGDAKGDGILLKRSPDIPERPNRLPKRDGVDVGIAMSSQLREHLRHGHTEFEHRFITVGFIKFTGTDDLLAEEGPAALTQAVGDAVAAVQEAAVDNGVTMLSSDMFANGVKIILTSGVPVAVGDDETRVLSALRRVVQPGGRLQVCAGVTCGSVFAGDYGPFYRKTYSITGDIVNLAARLMTKAGSGQIVALPEVLARSRTSFVTTELEPFLVKGKSAPVQALLVGDPQHASEREVADRGELVGRAAELAALHASAATAWEGAGQVIELVGPPGMGKSRLTDELVTDSSARVLWADGDIYARATPYQPMQRLLRRTLGVPTVADDAEVATMIVDLVTGTAPDLLPWLPLIGIVAGIELPPTPEVDMLDPEVRRSRLEVVTSDLLGRLLTSPTLFVFNDVQFMDDSTVAFIRRLADDVIDRPWVVLLTRRPTVESPIADAENVLRVVLEPLPADDADRLVAHATEDAPLPAHRMRQLVDRAGGNPLFLQQLIAGALAGADLDELPDSLEGVIAARIDQLPVRRRTWLRAVSVLGNSVEPEVLAEVLAGTELAEESWDGLDEFLTLHPDNQLRFAHHLVRLTAYEGLPFRRRAELHARAADVLERAGGDADPALLSLHSFNGGRYEQAWRYSRQAGDQARDSYAPAEAAALYSRAVAAAGHLRELDIGDVTDVYEALADVRLDLGEMPQAEAALRQARLKAKTDPHRLARLQLKTARQRQHTGRHADAMRWVSRGRSSLRGLTDSEGLRLMAELAERGALVRYDQGAYKAAMDWAMTSVREAKLAGDPGLEARGMGVLVGQAALAGLPVDESRVHASLELYERTNDLRGLARTSNALGVWAYFAGRWDLALDYYAAAEEASRMIGRDYDAAAAAANRAEVLIQQHRFDEAESVLLPSVRALLAANATSFLAFGVALRGRIALSRGDFLEAASQFGEARALCLEMGELGEAFAIEAHAAECHLQAGELTEALSAVAETLSRATGTGQLGAAGPQLHRVRGEALIRLGRIDEGRQALQTSLAAGREYDTSYEIEACLRTMIRLGAAENDAEEQRWRSEQASLLATLGIVS